MVQDQKRAYSPEEFAVAIGVHKHTIQRKLRSGELFGVRFGRKWVIPAKTLEDFLAGKRNPPAGE